ncbi:hypothetical protein BDR26DRAFT_855916 [Obelidium mucronatum]|nr:hypothetical protein BDR26DRAFT_855916 [Obelidium mucronatum]
MYSYLNIEKLRKEWISSGMVVADVVDGTDCNFPETNKTQLSLPIRKCISTEIGSSILATIEAPDNAISGLFVDVSTFRQSNACLGEPTAVSESRTLNIGLFDWIMIACGCVAVALILFFVLRPLFRRPPSFEQSREDAQVPVLSRNQGNDTLPAYDSI